MKRGNRRTRDTNAVLKASLFLAVSAALFLGMFFLYGRLGRTWRGVFEYRVLFTQLHKLIPTEPIRYNGMELGRVRDVRIAKLDGELLKNLRPISKNDLRNLPLTDAERAGYSLLADEAVDPIVRKAIVGRHMTVATLEILTDQDDNRLHSNDAYFVSTSAIGEAAIEIVSVPGPPLPQRPGTVLLGINADLISDIGKSMEQVADLMGAMGEMVGGESGARNLVSSQLGNLDTFAKDLDDRTAEIAKKVPEFWTATDQQLVGADKGTREMLKSIADLKPQVEKALAETDKSIQAIHDDMVGSTVEAKKEIADYRRRAKDELARWRDSSKQARESFPTRAQDLRALSQGALDAAGQLDDILDQVELKMRESVSNARSQVNDNANAALGAQENMWHFKRNVGHFTSKYTRDELASQHQDWRKDMARTQYIELRRELNAIQQNLSTADAADVVRARHISQLLDESDAYFGVNRNDFPPIVSPPVTPGGTVRPGTPVPLNDPPASIAPIEKEKRKGGEGDR